MKRGATEALRQHREDIQAGTEQMPEDPQLYWNRMRPICTTRLADVAADLLTVPASSVPSERLFSVAGVMCAGKKHAISDANLERRVLLKCNLVIMD